MLSGPENKQNASAQNAEHENPVMDQLTVIYFRGEPVSRLIDYICLIDDVRALGMASALVKNTLELEDFLKVTNRWFKLLASDQSLQHLFLEYMAGNRDVDLDTASSYKLKAMEYRIALD